MLVPSPAAATAAKYQATGIDREAIRERSSGIDAQMPSAIIGVGTPRPIHRDGKPALLVRYIAKLPSQCPPS